MNTVEREALYELAALLEMALHDLHPCYANTSRRGRGIGGQMVTQQCNVIDPEGAEHDLLELIEEAVREKFRQAEADGVDMGAVRARLRGIAQGSYEVRRSGSAVAS